MDDPDYGTVPNERMPVISSIGTKEHSQSQARILAGEVGNGFGRSGSGNDNGNVKTDDVDDGDEEKVVGPFQTKQPVQMIDFEIEEDDTIEFQVADGLDTIMLYIYEGALKEVNGQENHDLTAGSIILFDVKSTDRNRTFILETANAASSIDDETEEGTGRNNKNKKAAAAGVLLFAGKKLKEPIVWHGPIVMNTEEEIYETYRDMKLGNFPPKRVPWDYKEYNTRPIDWDVGADDHKLDDKKNVDHNVQQCVEAK